MPAVFYPTARPERRASSLFFKMLSKKAGQERDKPTEYKKRAYGESRKPLLFLAPQHGLPSLRSG